MTPESRTLVRVSGALATRDAEAIRRELGTAVSVCEPDPLEEALLQAYLFLGYPASLGAFALWREVSGRSSGASRQEQPTDWAARGEEVCRRVYGSQYEALRRNVAALHPELDRWMVSEGYGRVLGRPGLPLPDRELAIVGLLAVLDAPVQLYSHMRGALAVGVPPVDVEEALRAVEDFMSEATRERAWECWARVQDPEARTGG